MVRNIVVFFAFFVASFHSLHADGLKYNLPDSRILRGAVGIANCVEIIAPALLPLDSSPIPRHNIILRLVEITHA